MAAGGIQILGLDDLEKTFKELGDVMGQDALDDGLRAGARVFVKAIKQEASDDPELAKSFTVAKATQRQLRRGRGSIAVVARSGRAWQGFRAWWREDGTDPHRIIIKKKLALADTEAGKFFGPVVFHPGEQAKPFMRPAIDRAAEKALRAIKDRLGVAIDKGVARRGAGFARLRGGRRA